MKAPGEQPSKRMKTTRLQMVELALLVTLTMPVSGAVHYVDVSSSNPTPPYVS